MTATTIRELFAKKVDRPIDGVIKADDDRNLKVELDEYVVTRDVRKGLGAFVDCYLDNPTANGVWISGFFGCGKSHLLKMLSLLLDSERLVGPDNERPADILLPKVDDEIIKANLRKAISTPARSVLFNIDQKYDGIGGEHSAPILEVFMKVLNELQGYYGNQGYIARFEHDLDKRGVFGTFKETYLRLNHRSWENDREAVATVTKSSFAKAYAELFSTSSEEAMKVIGEAKADYRLSIEGFAARVKDYLESQSPGFRLNFFVDEAGQFIGQDRSRLLNLQTVVESLATATNGRASVFVTSQADLEGILGEEKMRQADDLSKIQGRFRTKLTLASADVQEVIQRRLLEKKPEEPQELISIYGAEKDNFQTLFRFGDNSLQLKGWADCQAFCGLYPFHPYQLNLFQQALQSLAIHNVFGGRNMAVGERSMLSVFQEVAKAIMDLPIGQLASFDQLYDGIRDVIRGDKQQTMVLAERQVAPLELRILKALFLLKWVTPFKASPRNIAILLINQPNLDIRAHEQQVKEALRNLESQSYLQRSGELYEFLTDKEKDVEQEIKATTVEDSQVMAALQIRIFNDVLRTNKIRFEDNNQDYTYAQKIDDALVKGKPDEVAVNVITPEHPNYGNEAVLVAQNMGRADLMVILPTQGRLTELIRNYLKTEKYIKQNSGGEDEALKEILAQRGRQNSARGSEITRLASEALRHAPLVVNGKRLEVGEADPQNRFSKAYQELIRSAYPMLRMVKQSHNEGTLMKVVQEQDDLLDGSDLQLSEAEQEVFTEVIRRQNLEGERTSAADLIRTFEARPYGWSNWATLTFLGRLYRLGKVELREGEILSPHEVIDALTNSRRQGLVLVRKKEVIDPRAINDLKRFHLEFFGKASSGSDSRTTATALREAMASEAAELEAIASQQDRYPFVAALAPIATKLRELNGKDDTYLLKQQAQFTSELLDQQDDCITPIKQFLKGDQKLIFEKVRAFLAKHGDDLMELPPEPVAVLERVINNQAPYRGSLLPEAHGALATLEALLEERLQQARSEALAKIEEQETKLKAGADFRLLTAEQQGSVLATTQQVKHEIAKAEQPARVQLRMDRFQKLDVPALLQRVAALAAPTDTPPVPITVVPASSLKPNFPLGQITNSQELQQWLEALRASAQAELDQGHRISL